MAGEGPWMSGDIHIPGAMGLVAPWEQICLPTMSIFSEISLHGAQKTRAGSHLPNEGQSIMLPLFCFLSFLSLTSHLLNPTFTPDLHPHTVLLQTLQVQVTKTHLRLAYTNKKNVLVHLTGNVRVYLASITIGFRGSNDVIRLFLHLSALLLTWWWLNLSCNGKAFCMKQESEPSETPKL